MYVYAIEYTGFSTIHSTARKALEYLLGQTLTADLTPVIQDETGNYIMGTEKTLSLTEESISKFITIINKNGYVTFTEGPTIQKHNVR